MPCGEFAPKGKPKARRVGARIHIPASLNSPQDASDNLYPPPDEDDDADEHRRRRDLLDRMCRSGRLTPVEIRTLYALVVEGCSLTEIAKRDGCSRQAVVARLAGSSAGHGGVVRKLHALNAARVATSEQAA